MSTKEARKNRQEKLKENGITTINLVIELDNDIYKEYKELVKYKYATSVKNSIANLITNFVNEHRNINNDKL